MVLAMTDWSDHRDLTITTVIITVPLATANVRLGRLAVRYRGNCDYRGHRSRRVCGTVSVLHRGSVGHRRRTLGLTRVIQLKDVASCQVVLKFYEIKSFGTGRSFFDGSLFK